MYKYDYWIAFVLDSFSPAALSSADAKRRFHTLGRPRYNVAKMMSKRGDAKILFLLSTLANCPKTQSTNIYGRCKARYEGLSTR